MSLHMNTQEFLTNLDTSAFSEQTREKMRALIGDTTEITPELKASLLALMQEEIEQDLGDVPLDTMEAQTIEKELSDALEQIEQEAQADIETVEREVRELADMSQKVDVLERLHP